METAHYGIGTSGEKFQDPVRSWLLDYTAGPVQETLGEEWGQT